MREVEDEIKRNEQEAPVRRRRRALTSAQPGETGARSGAPAPAATERARSTNGPCAPSAPRSTRLVRAARLRAQRDSEEDDAEAHRLGVEVKLPCALKARGRRCGPNAQVEPGRAARGRRAWAAADPRVTPRLIEKMPLYEGADAGLDVTIDPGLRRHAGRQPAQLDAARVVAEVEGRIARHVAKEAAERDGISLDDEKKFGTSSCTSASSASLAAG